MLLAHLGEAEAMLAALAARAVAGNKDGEQQ